MISVRLRRFLHSLFGERQQAFQIASNGREDMIGASLDPLGRFILECKQGAGEIAFDPSDKIPGRDRIGLCKGDGEIGKAALQQAQGDLERCDLDLLWRVFQDWLHRENAGQSSYAKRSEIGSAA